MQITLTPERAYASGRDAGNMSMRKAGRKKWNTDDYNAAVEKTNKLMACLYPEISDRLDKGA